MKALFAKGSKLKMGMKFTCAYCNGHVEHKDLDSHLRMHQETIKDVELKKWEVFHEVVHKCPSCSREKLTFRVGKMVCQFCSFITIPYISLE